MLKRNDIEQAVEEHICSLLEEAGDPLDDPIAADTELHELGINSLMLARLLIQLDVTFGVDNPFESDEVLADVRSIGDVVDVYDRALLNGGARLQKEAM